MRLRHVAAVAAFIALLVGLGIASDWSARVLGAGAILAVAVVIVVWWVRSEPGCLGWFFLVASVVAVGGGIYGLIEPELLTSEEEAAALEKLEAREEQFVTASGTPTEGEPVVNGRIVPVNIGKREIDEGVYVRLPDRLQARNAREATTVVLVEYTKEVVGHYQDGDEAVQEFANLTIVDLVTGKQYEGDTIVGPRPPSVKSGSASGEGGPLDRRDIADYLRRLPRAGESASSPTS